MSRRARTHDLRTGKWVFLEPGERSVVVGAEARGKVWRAARRPDLSCFGETPPVVRLL